MFLRMKVGLYYDQSFKTQYGDNSVLVMRQVLAQVRLRHKMLFKANIDAITVTCVH